MAGSDPAEGMDDLVFVVCRVGSGLCDVLINRSVESYRVYVPGCDLGTSKRGGLVRFGQQRPPPPQKERKKERKKDRLCKYNIPLWHVCATIVAVEN
jgi:hypothetical protein